jgi:hypothetical protein
MAKLPSVSDLGPTPDVSGDRPIASYDVSPYARGAQALAQSGAALAKGVAQVGEGIGDYEIGKDRYEYAVAQSGFLTDHINIESGLQHDQDYPTLQQRYKDQATDKQGTWAETISNPAMRDRFIAATGQTIAQGEAKTKDQAYRLEGNTQVAYVQNQGNNLIEKTVQDPTNDPLVDQSAQAYGGMVDGLQGRGFVTPEQALTMKQNHAQRFAIAHGIARSQVDPVGMLNELRTAPGSPEQIDNRIIQVESNGDPLARSKTSSASGLGQFTNQTWLSLIKQVHPELAADHSDAELLALRADRGLSREMVTANRVQNTAYLKGQGIDATAGNIYLAHFLGPKDAATVLRVDPNTPVADILDPKVIAANQSILAGKTAGTVAQWADGKMGGVGPGGGHLYDILRPDQRGLLEQHADNAAHAQAANTISTFHNSVQDDVYEANRTGAVSSPKNPEQFIAAYGAAAGPQAYKNYQADIQAGADRTKFAGMSPADIGAAIQRYTPQPGPGYAEAAKRQDDLIQSAQAILKERQTDPAGFAINRMPVVQGAWANLSKVLADPTSPADAKQAAARDFATKTIMEQQRVGIPDEARQLLPKSYISQLTTSIGNAAASDDPTARVGLISRIQNEAAVWGDNWPLVMRQLAPNTAPIVRAIAAGADPSAMVRLLNLPKGENPAKILKEQDETKAAAVNTAVNEAMAPFLKTLVGRQRDRDYPGYADLAGKLAALDVRDGKSPSDAAANAFGALVGNRYDFKDTYRIPKSAGVPADDVQAGAQAARAIIGSGQPADLAPDLQKNFQRNSQYVAQGANKFQTDLTPADESAFQQWVQKNNVPFDPKATGPQDYDMRGFWKGLQNGDARAQSAVDKNDGKMHYPDYWKTPYHQTFSNESQWANGNAPGWNDKDQLVGKNGAVVYDDRAANKTPFGIKPAIADIPGLPDNRGDSLKKFGRDGVFVTAPDNSGLNLSYGGKFVRRSDGSPLLLSWKQLGGLAKTQAAKTAADLVSTSTAMMP